MRGVIEILHGHLLIARKGGPSFIVKASTGIAPAASSSCWYSQRHMRNCFQFQACCKHCQLRSWLRPRRAWGARGGTGTGPPGSTGKSKRHGIRTSVLQRCVLRKPEWSDCPSQLACCPFYRQCSSVFGWNSAYIESNTAMPASAS